MNYNAQTDKSRQVPFFGTLEGPQLTGDRLFYSPAKIEFCCPMRDGQGHITLTNHWQGYKMVITIHQFLNEWTTG